MHPAVEDIKLDVCTYVNVGWLCVIKWSQSFIWSYVCVREQHKTKMHRSGSVHSAGGSLKQYFLETRQTFSLWRGFHSPRTSNPTQQPQNTANAFCYYVLGWGGGCHITGAMFSSSSSSSIFTHKNQSVPMQTAHRYEVVRLERIYNAEPKSSTLKVYHIKKKISKRNRIKKCKKYYQNEMK